MIFKVVYSLEKYILYLTMKSQNLGERNYPRKDWFKSLNSVLVMRNL